MRGRLETSMIVVASCHCERSEAIPRHHTKRIGRDYFGLCLQAERPLAEALAMTDYGKGVDAGIDDLLLNYVQ